MAVLTPCNSARVALVAPREYGYKLALSRNTLNESRIAEVADPVVCQAGQIGMRVSSSPKLSEPSQRTTEKRISISRRSPSRQNRCHTPTVLKASP